MPIKILDLFAGAGGLSYGFELVKDIQGNNVFELHKAVEIDKYACETLRKNYGADKVIQGDLTKKEIHQRVINECKSKVSVIVGGIPCQSFSLIGPRSGYGIKEKNPKEDQRDNLYHEFRDIVEEIKPNIIVIENVKGILSKKDSGGKKIIDKIISDFEKQGYTFNNEKIGKKYLLVNAADYGVPQKRERVILIGIKKSWKNIAVPSIETTHYNPKLGNTEELKKKGLSPYVTLYEAIGDLPEVSPKLTKTDIPVNQYAKIIMKNEKIYSGKDKINLDKEQFHKYLATISSSGRSFFEFVRPNGYRYIDHHVARRQQQSDIILFEKMREGETAIDFFKRNPKTARKLIKYQMDSFLDKYRKQKSNEISTTLFAHLEKDGNRFIHPFQARTMTPREAARLQSFPDDFTFEGPLGKKFRQIGNAVPPLMSYNIAKSIQTILECESYA